MNNYLKFNKSRENGFNDGEMYGLEKFGELLLIITTLGMLSQERNNSSQNDLNNIQTDENDGDSTNTKDSLNGDGETDGNNSIPSKSTTTTTTSNYEILQFYDHLIHEFIKSNLNSICSIPSLQLSTLEMIYCLVTGDLTTCYELRGKIITMAQQLRLHRCPAAVLGSSGSNVSKLQQGERRILFWCIYILDSFSSLILGVPRLLKDYEIECALPSSLNSNNENEDESNLVYFNNMQLKLSGKVSESALAMMRYSKVLGSIVDSIFKRSNNNLKKPQLNDSTYLILEDLLDSWRRKLPNSINFEMDNNGNVRNNDYEKLNETQLTLLFLYYKAKIIINNYKIIIIKKI
ncbi:unnamed protein product [[Candida] boidinii]|uniref:Unnamed protein product n=1 Tax=Candida boidinii TaxID=5477 RepID=A0ACB5U1T8_CANBO|nr:unnamed protein product [[Candida] boidinii]